MPFLLCLAVLFLLAPINPPITPDNAAQVQVLTRIEAAGSDPRALAFNPLDSRQLALAQGNGLVTLWDVTDGSQVSQWQVAETAVNGVAYLPNGRRLVTIADNGSVLVQDIVTGETLRDWTILGEIPVVLDTDSQNHVAIGYRDGTTRLWDATSGKHLITLYGYPHGMTAVDISPDGDYVAVGSMDVFLYQLGDIDQGEAYIEDVLDGGELRDVVFHPSPQYGEFINNIGLAVASNFTPIQFWDPRGGLERGTYSLYQTDALLAYPFCLSFNGDGSLLVVGGTATTRGGGDGYSTIQIVAGLHQAGRLPVLATLNNQAEGLTDLAFSLDSQYIASSFLDGLLLIWGVPAG